jgi:hypothetical protein
MTTTMNQSIRAQVRTIADQDLVGRETTIHAHFGEIPS